MTTVRMEDEKAGRARHFERSARRTITLVCRGMKDRKRKRDDDQEVNHLQARSGSDIVGHEIRDAVQAARETLHAGLFDWNGSSDGDSNEAMQLSGDTPEQGLPDNDNMQIATEETLQEHTRSTPIMSDILSFSDNDTYHRAWPSTQPQPMGIDSMKRAKLNLIASSRRSTASSSSSSGGSCSGLSLHSHDHAMAENIFSQQSKLIKYAAQHQQKMKRKVDIQQRQIAALKLRIGKLEEANNRLNKQVLARKE
ncbi:unnamed protein product [Sympodiomycopsis kandeliae]